MGRVVSAAAELKGQVVVGEGQGRKWQVLDQITFEPGVSAGHNSYGYRATRDDGASAFLKATDLRLASMGDSKFLEQLKLRVDAHTVERKLLDRAKERNLDKVVTVIDYGTLDTSHDGSAYSVLFLIFELADGDVLMVEGHATVTEIGRSAVWRSPERGMLHQNHLIRARCSEALIPEYLNLCINGGVGQDYFRSRAKSSSGLNTINSTVVKEFPVPITPVPDQQKLIAEVTHFDRSLRAVESNQASLRKLIESILNTVVS